MRARQLAKDIGSTTGKQNNGKGWCKELQESSFREILSINPDNLPEALAMQHDIAMENVRRTGRKIGLGILSHNS